MTNDREFIELQCALILSVDGLVSEETGGRDHVGGHAVAWRTVR